MTSHSVGQDFVFQLPGCDPKYAGTVLAGERGQLEWPADLPEQPEQNLLATTPADFVAPDGRRLAGNVPTHALQGLAAQGSTAVTSRPLDSVAVTANAVDLGASWPLTVHRSVLLLIVAALALPIPLYVVPHMGGAGVALLIGSAASAVSAFAVTLYHDAKHKPQAGAG